MLKEKMTTPAKLSAWIPEAVLIISLVLTVGITYYVRSSADMKDQLRFDDTIARTQLNVMNKIDLYLSLLKSTAAMFTTYDVTHDEFHAFVERVGLRESYRGMQGLGYSQRIDSQDKESAVAVIQSQRLDQFSINPDYPRAEYHTIIYLEPEDKRNNVALGFDMFTDPVRRTAMEKARDAGKPAASGKVTLVQEVDAQKQAGFLIYVPVYASVALPATVEARRKMLKGFVYSPFRTDDLLTKIIANENDHGLYYDIYDGLSVNSKSRIYSSRSSNHQAPLNSDSRFRRTKTMNIAGRPWTMVFTTSNSFDTTSERGFIPYILSGGITISFILFTIIRAQQQARAAAERSAAERKRLEKQKDEFIGIASHELKTPLTSIKAYYQVLFKRFVNRKDTETTKLLSKTNTQIDKLTNLISDLLDVTKIEAGKLQFHKVCFDMHDLIEEIIEDFQAINGRHSILYDRVANDSIPAELIADRERIGQVITNFISNAIKYSPHNDKIIISLTQDGTSIVVSVKDYGLGIPKDKQTKVFERFFRVGGPKKETYPGLGLGLYISADIIKRHGGKIWVKSTEGKGSVFSFKIPRGK